MLAITSRGRAYSLNVAQHLPDTQPQDVQHYSGELTTLAASLNLPANAQAVANAHFAAVKETAMMDKGEIALWSQRQTTMLHSIIGADAKLKAASDTLSKASGRKLDLPTIVASNGADVALTLYHQAQALAARK